MEETMLLQERAKMVETVIMRAWADESFKAQLVENPGKALEAAFGTKLPPSIAVKVIEETAETRYLVIPYRPKAGDELSNQELEAVAGGGSGTSISATPRLNSLVLCGGLIGSRIANIGNIGGI
jgi:hypothetical protein